MSLSPAKPKELPASSYKTPEKVRKPVSGPPDLYRAPVKLVPRVKTDIELAIIYGTNGLCKNLFEDWMIHYFSSLKVCLFVCFICWGICGFGFKFCWGFWMGVKNYDIWLDGIRRAVWGWNKKFYWGSGKERNGLWGEISGRPLFEVCRYLVK